MSRFSIESTGLRPIQPTSIKLQKNTEYYLGASDDPTHIIITNLTDSMVTYRSYPYKKDRRIERWIGEDLIVQGTNTWLKSGYSDYHPKLAVNLRRLLSGKTGTTVKLKDFKRVEVLVKPNKRNYNARIDYWRLAETFGGVGGRDNKLSPTGMDYTIDTHYKGLSKIKKNKYFTVVSTKEE